MNYTVGRNVDSWCTRCKLILAHTIEAIASGQIKRVHCNTCKGKHTHKAYAPGEKPSPRSSSPSRTASSSASGRSRMPADVARASDYQRMLDGRDAYSARDYGIRETFKQGNLVAHKLFGLGVVIADKGANKVEVLFSDGPKVLVHAK